MSHACAMWAFEVHTASWHDVGDALPYPLPVYKVRAVSLQGIGHLNNIWLVFVAHWRRPMTHPDAPATMGR
jgi:hypothetical protein